MSEGKRSLGCASVARMVGLGLAGALALSATAPSIAWAGEGGEPATGQDQPAEAGVATGDEGSPDQEAPVAVTPTREPTVLDAPEDATAAVAPATQPASDQGDALPPVEGEAEGPGDDAATTAMEACAGAPAAGEPAAAPEGQDGGTSEGAETEGGVAGDGGAAMLAGEAQPAPASVSASVPAPEPETQTATRPVPAATGARTAADEPTAAEPVLRTADEDQAAGTTTAASPASAEQAGTAAEAPVPALVNVYRLFNPYSLEHLYTRDLDEALSDASVGWQWEGPAYTASTSDTGTAVYRLYNRYDGLHHYTTAASERDALAMLGWTYEGVSWFATGDGALFRLYNPYDGNHLYTADASEATYLGSIGWSLESTSAWAIGSSTIELDSGRWLVTSAWGSPQRYWIGRDGQVAKGRYVEKSEGSGWRAYATSDGAIVRGFHALSDTSGLVADDKGELLEGEGMVVTGAYTGGTLERYFLSAGTLRLGEFSLGGRSYFGRRDTGYLVRGDYFDPSTGTMYRGDDDAVLQVRGTSRDSYVDWALAMAKDDSHGYSQYNRWGPNYDCSSLVISALRQAGYQTGGASYTGDMYAQLSSRGWYQVAVDASRLQYGDILLNDTHHTAIYLANGWLVQASSDENGSIEGYVSGDQTGREIWYRGYYDYPWTRVLRHA